MIFYLEKSQGLIDFIKYNLLLLLTKLNDVNTYLIIIVFAHFALTKINRFFLIDLKSIIIIININMKYVFDQEYEFLIKRHFMLRLLSKAFLKFIQI